MGMISSLPASMSNIRINFEKTEKSEKLPVGPTMSSPGPMLFNVAVIAVKFVVKSKPFKLNNKSEPTKTMTYAIKNTLQERRVTGSTSLLSIFVMQICLG